MFRKAAALLSLAAAFFALAGCGKKQTPTVLLPPPPLTLPPAPPTAPPPPSPANTEVAVALNILETAEREFEAGRFGEAAGAYDRYLREADPVEERDRVLFRLGMSLALKDGSQQSLNRARERFRTLIGEFPGSPYRPPAEYILGLHSEIEKLRSESRKLNAEVQGREERIKRLTSELERLKKIDLERRPPRPPD